MKLELSQAKRQGLVHIFGLYPAVSGTLDELTGGSFADGAAFAAGEALVTLIYHRKLGEDWEAEARALEEELDIMIIGRSRKQHIVLARDHVFERLEVDGREYVYQQAWITTLSDDVTHTTGAKGPSTDNLDEVVDQGFDFYHASVGGVGPTIGGSQLAHTMFSKGSDYTVSKPVIRAASEVEGGAADETAPSPDPLTGAQVAFSSVDHESMTLTVTGVTDASTPILYTFECVTSGCTADDLTPGDNTHTATGLDPSTPYEWDVRAIDDESNSTGVASISQSTSAQPAPPPSSGGGGGSGLLPNDSGMLPQYGPSCDEKEGDGWVGLDDVLRMLRLVNDECEVFRP